MTSPNPSPELGEVLERVRHWLAQHIPGAPDPLPMQGDLSARWYLRVAGPKQRMILAVYPADQLPVFDRFVETTRLLEAVGIPVPEILVTDRARGMMALSDVGEHTVHDLAVAGRDPGPWLREAAALLPRIQAIVWQPSSGLLPPLNNATLDRELGEAWDRFLVPEGLAGRSGTLRDGLSVLCQHLDDAPRVPCHRDYMARNLLVESDGEPITVVDHQDLRLGPRYYDLASLLNDSVFAAPGLEEELLELYAPTPGQRTDYHRAVVQRGLKAIATFLRFAERGRPRHLPLVRPTASRVWRSLKQAPELVPLVSELAPAWNLYLGRSVA